MNSVKVTYENQSDEPFMLEGLTSGNVYLVDQLGCTATVVFLGPKNKKHTLGEVVKGKLTKRVRYFSGDVLLEGGSS